MRSYTKTSTNEEDLPWNVLKDFKEFAAQEITMFLTALKVNSKSTEFFSIELCINRNFG